MVLSPKAEQVGAVGAGEGPAAEAGAPSGRAPFVSVARGCIRDTAAGLVDLLWPPQCCICGQGGETFLCHKCRAGIDLVEAPYCSRCGRPGVRTKCEDCGEAPWLSENPCDALRQVAVYDGVWREAIHHFKYDGMRPLAGVFGEYLRQWLEGASAPWHEVDAVVPVPGHFTRGWVLGFHHGHELAKQVAEVLDVPLVNPVVRLRGPSQMRLSREQRLQNARRIYRLSRKAAGVEGRHLLLVDDVVTTGATAGAVAELLKSAGARKVRMLALARNV